MVGTGGTKVVGVPRLKMVVGVEVKVLVVVTTGRLPAGGTVVIITSGVFVVDREED